MEIVEKPWCVWEVFQRLEEADPSFVALVDGGVGVTRTELRQRTEELDRLLRSLGVVRGSPVMLVNECNTFALVRPLTHAPHRLPHSRGFVHLRLPPKDRKQSVRAQVLIKRQLKPQLSRPLYARTLTLLHLDL